MFDAEDFYWKNAHVTPPADCPNASWAPLRHYVGFVLPKTAGNYQLDAALERIKAQYEHLLPATSSSINQQDQ